MTTLDKETTQAIKKWLEIKQNQALFLDSSPCETIEWLIKDLEEDYLHIHNDKECWGDHTEHGCHFCGTITCKEGYEYNGKRHFLSDCRPDLVQHEIGETCTWSYRRGHIKRKDGTYLEPLLQNKTCYAYQDSDRNWTDEHKHFYPDGPC
jgi:hypothetical protein